MGNINPTFGFNFPTETIMKIGRIINFCLQPNHHGLHSTMSDVIEEINGALQLEEGLKAEEGVMKIEIPQYASQLKTGASFETILDHEFKWHRTFDDISDFELTSNFELVDINPERKSQQQPQTIFSQSHGSRSVFQIVLIYHLMHEMTRGWIVNNLCCGIE